MTDLNTIPMTSYEDIMPYFNKQINVYDCNQSILWLRLDGLTALVPMASVTCQGSETYHQDETP